MEDRSILTEPLQNHLQNLHILWLSQARDLARDLPFPNKWLSSETLGLSGEATTEWKVFVKSLRSTTIFLKHETDYLLWAGGDTSGVLTIKNIYTDLLCLLDYCCDSVWIQKMWKWPLQLKIKLFIWLGAKEKVLTWEAL